MNKQFLKRNAPFLTILIVVSIFIGRYIFFGKVIYWGIPTLQFIPWHWEAWNQLREGALPLWNPYNGMGAPLLANYQLALFYPPGWLLYLFAAVGGASWLAWGHSLLVLLHLVWAGWGMVALCRSWKIPATGQMIAGLSYAMGGYLAARTSFFSIIWCAAWIPWFLYAIEKLLLTADNADGDHWNKISRISRAAIILGMLILAGHAQLLVYTLEWSLLWVVYRSWMRYGGKGIIRNVLVYCSVAILAFMFTAVQLLPTLEYLSLSSRSTAVDFETALSYSFWGWKFITLVSPDFFGNPGNGTYWGYSNYWEDAVYLGIIPLSLAITTVIKKKNKSIDPTQSQTDSLVPFLWASIVVSFILALGKNTPIFPFLYEYVPFMDMFNAPVRYLVIAATSLSLLAGIGFMNWQRPTGRSMYWFRLATAGGAALTIGAFLAVYLLDEVELTFVRSLAVTGCISMLAGLLTIFKPDKKGFGDHVWSLAVVAVVAFDLLWAQWKLVPAVSGSLFNSFSNSPSDRSSFIEPRIFISGEDEYIYKYERFLRFEDYRILEDQSVITDIPLPNTNLLISKPMVNNFDPLVPARYQEWMDALSLEDSDDLTTMLQSMNVGLWKQLDITDETGVLSNEIVADGFYSWFPCSKFVSGDEDAMSVTLERFRNGHEEINESVILEVEDHETAPYKDCVCNNVPDITLGRHSAAVRDINITALCPGWLVINEANYPGWTARLDEKRVQIYPANYLFQSVYIPVGRHELTFRYMPMSFQIGLSVTLVTWIIASILLVIIAKRQKKVKKDLETVDDH
ncbi:MAG: YfhO family protein [Anaerolineae bacterium]|nr:YfhO family protein [Anaerolineae bacterium]